MTMKVIPLMMVRVSSKWLRKRFNGCQPDFIRDVCKGACCRSSKGNALVTVLEGEKQQIENYGCNVVSGMIQTGKRCPFQDTQDLCTIHSRGKPFGCIASPFTLNRNRTLIIRHRYLALKCYNAGRKLPAYRAFYTGLELIMGRDKAVRLVEHLDNGGGDIEVFVEDYIGNALLDNDKARKNKTI